jgi:GxxExxY protein
MNENEELEFVKELHSGKDLFTLAKERSSTPGELKIKLEDIVWKLYKKDETRETIQKVLNLEREVVDYIIKKREIEQSSVSNDNKKATMYEIGMLAETIFNILGPGYSERVYHNAMEVLLRSKNIPYESERIIPIPFNGHVIGNLRADIIVNNETILEFKTIKTLNESAEIQCHNYLRLTGLKTAYLINFPPFEKRPVEVRCIALPERKETPE